MSISKSLSHLRDNALREYKAKNFKLAAELYRRIYEDYKMLALDDLLKLAISERLTGNFKKSHEIIIKALEHHPNKREVYVEYAALESKKGNFEKANELWFKARSLGNQFSELNYRRHIETLNKIGDKRFSSILLEAIYYYPECQHFKTTRRIIEMKERDKLNSEVSSEIEAARDLWDFEKIAFLYDRAASIDISNLPDLIRNLCDTGKLDYVEKKLTKTEFQVISHFTELDNISSFVFNEFRAADHIPENDVCARLIKFTNERKVSELLSFIKKNHSSLFDIDSSPKQNMLLNYSINKIISYDALDIDTTKEIINLYFFNKNINVNRKKYVCKTLIDYWSIKNPNDFFKYPKKYHHKDFNYLQQLQSIIYNYKNELGARLLIDKLSRLIKKHNKFELTKRKDKEQRIAICISGMYRANDLALSTIVKNVVEPTGADVFFHTWDEWQKWPGIGGTDDYLFRLFGNKTKHLAPPDLRSFKKLKEILPRTAEIIETPIYEKLDIEYIQSLIRTTSCEVESDTTILSQLTTENFTTRGNSNQAKMFYGMHRAFELVKEHEKKENIKYDFVIRCRPDVGLKNKINIEDIYSLNEREVYIDFFHYGPTDQFFYAKRNTYEDIISIWDAMLKADNIIPFENYNNYDAHSLLRLWFSHHNLTPLPPNVRRDISLVTNNAKLPNISEAIKDDLMALNSNLEEHDRVLPFAELLINKAR